MAQMRALPHGSLDQLDSDWGEPSPSGVNLPARSNLSSIVSVINLSVLSPCVNVVCDRHIVFAVPANPRHARVYLFGHKARRFNVSTVSSHWRPSSDKSTDDARGSRANNSSTSPIPQGEHT